MRRFQLILGAALLISSLWCYGGREKTSPPSGNYPYDIATEITVSGTVDQLREYQCPVTGTVGSHITLKTEKGTIEVHLAPARFLKDYEITIRSGDAVKLVAAQITYEGKPALLAKTITINKETFSFRSAQGVPLW